MSFWLNNNANDVQKAVDNALEIFNLIYPIGSIYMSVNPGSPQALFGGTWEQIKDTFLLAAGNTYEAGEEGGEATHTLTTQEMPYHRHGSSILLNQSGYSQTSNPWELYIDNINEITGFKSTNGTAGTLTDVNYRQLRPTTYTGNSNAHNNMPPYLAVYVWKRTA